MQVSRAGQRIVKARFALNRHCQRLGREPIFKATAETEYISCLIPQVVVANEDEFREFVDRLYKYIYESSGQLKRVSALINVDGTPMMIKGLRNYYFHDLEHGDAKDIEKKYKRVGDIFQDLIGLTVMRTSDHWQRAQLSLLRRVERLIQDIEDRLAS